MDRGGSLHWGWKAVGAATLAIIAYLGAAGGPENAWLHIRLPIWGHPGPKIVSIEAAPESDEGTYILAIRNPALEDVAITGYVAGPVQLEDVKSFDMAVENLSAENVVSRNPTARGGGESSLVVPQERPPDRCGTREVAIARPVVIEPKRIVALRIRPWKEACSFSIVVLSDHGPSYRSSIFGDYVLDVN